MLGVIIGDLAAWTYEHDKNMFYNQLISVKAELSIYGHTYLKAASRNLLDVKQIDVSPIVSDINPRLSQRRQWLMWITLKAWSDIDHLKDCPDFDGICKEDHYVRNFVISLIKKLREGATKGQAYHSDPIFVEMSKDWNWRMNEVDYDEGSLSYVFRAWNAFYLGHDFASSIYNAVKWPGDKHFLCALTGAFASAMYGCKYIYQEKEFAVNEKISSDLINLFIKR